MAKWIETKYINLISSNLRNFSWVKGDTHARFSCPICGDSTKDKTKRRGNIFPSRKSDRSNSFFSYFCHNCCFSSGFDYFLKRVEPSLYDEFRLEVFRYNRATERTEGNTPSAVHRNDNTVTPSDSVCSTIFSPKDLAVSARNIVSIHSLEDSHPAKQYILNRQIPKRFWNDLYYTDNFEEAGKETFYESVSNSKCRIPNDARVLIPLMTRDEKVFGLQGRSLDPSCKLRYVTIRSHKLDIPRIWGMNYWNPSEITYIAEAAFDAMFLPNAMACCSAHFPTEIIVGDYDRFVFVFDNEKRNKQIIGTMKGLVDKGFGIFVWPHWILEKDLNEYVVNHSQEELMDMIKARTFYGQRALLEIDNFVSNG